jgi:hypothetical protein
MSRKPKIETYRIKDLETGLYYTGGIFGPYKNNEYEENDTKRKILQNRAEKWTHQEKADRNFWFGKHPWNLYFKPKWNEVGKIFVNLKGAEKSLSELTGVSIHTRSKKAKNILFGNRKSLIYVIVPCRILDRMVKSQEQNKEV